MTFLPMACNKLSLGSAGSQSPGHAMYSHLQDRCSSHSDFEYSGVLPDNSFLHMDLTFAYCHLHVASQKCRIERPAIRCPSG